MMKLILLMVTCRYIFILVGRERQLGAGYSIVSCNSWQIQVCQRKFLTCTHVHVYLHVHLQVYMYINFLRPYTVHVLVLVTNITYMYTYGSNKITLGFDIFFQLFTTFLGRKKVTLGTLFLNMPLAISICIDFSCKNRQLCMQLCGILLKQNTDPSAVDIGMYTGRCITQFHTLWAPYNRSVVC